MKKWWLAGFILFALCPWQGEAYAQHLIPGVGLQGILEIGQMRNCGSGVGKWCEDPRSGLRFRTDARGFIDAIKCDNPRYATDRNVRIGSPENDVQTSYGAARRERQVSGGRLYSYLGIGFAVRAGKVFSIYIFPRYLLKR